MRSFSLFFGFKAGLGAIMLISMFPMGAAHGAAIAPGEDIYLERSEVQVTTEDVESRDYQPWYSRAIEDRTPDALTFDTSYDPQVRAIVLDFTNAMIDSAVWIFNAGAEFGHTNRGWIDPAWARGSASAVLLGGLITYALSIGGLARREMA